MSVLNVPPGPRVGRILEAVTLAQVEGKIKNKEQALALLEKNKSAFLRFDNN